jgi:enamine deaminase RidA (YjgF/YER057c/UK114 family)
VVGGASLKKMHHIRAYVLPSATRLGSKTHQTSGMDFSCVVMRGILPRIVSHLAAYGLTTSSKRISMANQDITFTPDPDADSISSDVVGFAGVLVSTQIPTRADGSLELGDITLQSECTLQALKVALERAGSSMDRVMHLTIYLTDMADRAAFNEVYKRYFAKPWPVRAAVGVASLAVEGMRVEVTAMAAKA